MIAVKTNNVMITPVTNMFLMIKINLLLLTSKSAPKIKRKYNIRYNRRYPKKPLFLMFLK